MTHLKKGEIQNIASKFFPSFINYFLFNFSSVLIECTFFFHADLFRDSMASSSSSFPSSSIFSTSQWTYDVFLSFSGEDTRNTATDFIYFALKQKGIHTFKDDEKLEKGKAIESELFKAIKESRFAVVILSKNYAIFNLVLKRTCRDRCQRKIGNDNSAYFLRRGSIWCTETKGNFCTTFWWIWETIWGEGGHVERCFEACGQYCRISCT